MKKEYEEQSNVDSPRVCQSRLTFTIFSPLSFSGQSKFLFSGVLDTGRYVDFLAASTLIPMFRFNMPTEIHFKYVTSQAEFCRPVL